MIRPPLRFGSLWPGIKEHENDIAVRATSSIDFAIIDKIEKSSFPRYLEKTI